MSREMSLEELLSKAGSFKNLLKMIKDRGLDLEKEMQKVLWKEAPLFERIGLAVDKIQDGMIQMSFRYNEEIGRSGRMVHGGIGMYVIDTAAGLAVMTENPGVDQLTIELKVNFLEPLKKSPFRAVGRTVRVGKTTAVAEAEIWDADDRLCTKGLGTWYLITREASAKRMA
jgi:acyl-CoA thioesterase